MQFRSPTADPLDIASFAASVRTDFPKRQEQPSHAPLEESFEPPAKAPAFSIELLDRPPMPRFWLLSEHESRLIQIQHDFFAFNWRKVEETREYPRYSELRRNFRDFASQFEVVLQQAGKGALEPAWCEVTYVNHIEAPSESTQRLELSDVLSFIAPLPRDATVPRLEDTQLNQRFRVETDGDPVGRLHLAVASAFRASDFRPIWTLTLIGRLRTDEATLDGGLRRLDDCREMIVRAFISLTTPQMHETWGIEGGA
jgi:uncharacterized protein (TIGR04255 family)